MAQFEARKKIKILSDAGITNINILQTQAGVSRRTVYNVLKRIENNEPLEHRPVSGRPKICNGYDKRLINKIALENPTSSSKAISRMVTDRGGPKVHPNPILNYLHESAIGKMPPITVCPLTETQRAKRVTFCDQHLYENFQTTFFTDESSFCFQRNKCPRWSRGRRAEAPRSKFPKRLMVWGGISAMGPTPLALVQGNIGATKYVEILNDYFLPTARAFYGEQFTLQQDNASPHTAQSTRLWLGTNVPTVLDWPANSPDLSPIENLWGIIKNSVEKENAQNVAEFQRQVIEKWDTIPVDTLIHLIDSMPMRLEMCRDMRGARVNLNSL